MSKGGVALGYHANAAASGNQPIADAGRRAAIDAATDRYAVLVFRQATPLMTERRTAFTWKFGDLQAPNTQIQAAQGAR